MISIDDSAAEGAFIKNGIGDNKREYPAEICIGEAERLVLLSRRAAI